MKREEQIKSEANFSYNGNYKELQKQCFIQGAKWADKTMIEKACNWLFKNTYKHVDDSRVHMTFTYTADMIEKFRKAMEE